MIERIVLSLGHFFHDLAYFSVATIPMLTLVFISLQGHEVSDGILALASGVTGYVLRASGERAIEQTNGKAEDKPPQKP